MRKITPFLWFDNQAEEAARFYISVFKNSRLGEVLRRGEAGSVMSVTFTLDGQDFIAPNGGPHFKFTEAISFFVPCDSQAEVDELWEKLSEGGEKSRCGWLKDKFGVSWQVVPTVLRDLLWDKDPQKSRRVMEAMLQMDKLDIERLKQAHERD
jgi:predicted 3-demethylubiquinone-9 3-methyltransferase (glyoxalase superfamily)